MNPTINFYMGNGQEVTVPLMGDSLDEQLMSIGTIRRTMAKYGLSDKPPSKIFDYGGITQQTIAFVSRQQNDQGDEIHLFPKYFDERCGTLYLNTDEQRAEFQRHSGIDPLTIPIAKNNQKKPEQMVACEPPFEVIRVQKSMRKKDTQPSYRFVYVTPPPAPPQSVDGGSDTDDDSLPTWLRGNEKAFARVCAMTMGYQDVPPIERVTDAMVINWTREARRILNIDDWSGFASGKEAGQALKQAIAPPSNDKGMTRHAPTTNNETDEADGENPVPTTDDTLEGDSAGAEDVPADKIVLGEATLTLYQVACKVQPMRGMFWFFTPQDDAYPQIKMDNLDVWEEKGWDVSPWKVDDFLRFLPMVTVRAEKYPRGWQIVEVLTDPIPTMADDESEAPTPTHSDGEGSDAGEDDATIEYTDDKERGLFEHQLLRLLGVGNPYETLGIEYPDQYSVDELHRMAIEAIKAKQIPLVPSSCTFRKQGNKTFMVFETPLGLTLRRQASKTWWKTQLGEDLYKAHFQDWEAGTYKEPSVYSFGPSTFWFFLNWELDKNKQMKVTGAEWSPDGVLEGVTS